MNKQQLAREAVRAAITGDKEKAQYLVKRLDRPGAQCWMKLDDTDQYRSGNQIKTASELQKEQTLDAKMGFPWIKTTLNIG